MRILISIIFFLGVLFPRIASAAFTDVPFSHPSKDAITYLETKGIVQQGKIFRPDQRMNRAEFVTMLTKAFYPQLIDTCMQGYAVPFSDLIYDEWFKKYVCVAYRQSIVELGRTGRFNAWQNVSFPEAARSLVIAANIPHSSSSSGDFWVTAFGEALLATKAVPTSVQSFSHRMTRGEFAEMVYRLQKGITTKKSRTFQEFTQRNSQLPSKGFLYVQDLAEDESSEAATVHLLYAYDTDVQRSLSLGSLPLGRERWAFAIHKGNIYFIAENGEMKTLNVKTGKVQSMPLPEIAARKQDGSGYENILGDFLLTAQGQLFYLKGGCSESGPCSLLVYDLATSRGEVLLRNISIPVNGGVNIERFDSPRNAVVLVKRSGDAGNIWGSRHEFHLNSRSLRDIVAADYQSCGGSGPGGGCSGEGLAKNLRFEKLFPSFPSYCSGLVKRKPYPDYGVLFVTAGVRTIELAASTFVACL